MVTVKEKQGKHLHCMVYDQIFFRSIIKALSRNPSKEWSTCVQMESFFSGKSLARCSCVAYHIINLTFKMFIFGTFENIIVS